MVQQLSRSSEVRARKQARSTARKTPGMGGLRMAGGMVTKSSGGVAADMVTPPPTREELHTMSEHITRAIGATFQLPELRMARMVLIAVRDEVECMAQATPKATK